MTDIASKLVAVSGNAVDGGVAVSIRGLSKTFAGRMVLAGIELTIRRGEFVVLLGPSGTGKTTLLRLLAGLEMADVGEVLVPQKRTIVYQEPRLVPSMRVIDNVLIGQPSSVESRARALEALTEVNLATHAQAWPATLSGGEAQRVALARALVRAPELLLLDEPFAALDALTRLAMHTLVDELFTRYQPAVLLVTHDVDEALQLADRVIVLKEGNFALDIRLTRGVARSRTDATLVRHRRQLLHALGVDTAVDHG
jgi:sulfonate transport system ATP-binding protein